MSWLILVMACRTTDDGRPHRADVEPVPGAFAGVESVTWDHADGLVAAWQPVADADGYRIMATGPFPLLDAVDVQVDADRATGTVGGLTDGRYTVQVQALRSVATDDAPRSLDQVVGANRLDLVSFVERQGIGDVSGEGDVVVVAGRDSGTSFAAWDVSTPGAPLLLHAERDGGYVKDVKLVDGMLYTNGEQETGAPWDRIGARIWDLSEPTAPALLGTIGDPARSVHNVAYGDGMLYLSDNELDGVRAYDVSDPAEPVEEWSWVPEAGFVHDQVWVDGQLYVAWWRGFSVFDVSQPAAPVETLRYEAFGDIVNIHQVTPTEDGRHVLITSETSWGPVTVVDVSDPLDPVVVDVLASPTSPVSSHNVAVSGDIAYVAWYQDGCVALDISDPASPVEVGRFGTLTYGEGAPVPDPTKLYKGAWGVWPFGEYVAVSDNVRGLFVLKLYPDVVTADPPR